MRLSRLPFRVFFILSAVSFLFLFANARFIHCVQRNVGVSRGLVLEGFAGEEKSFPGFDVWLEPGPADKRVEALSISAVPWNEPARGASTITSTQV
jgi:hypothetical protein